jgi:hypothetical protein
MKKGADRHPPIVIRETRMPACDGKVGRHRPDKLPEIFAWRLPSDQANMAAKGS